ncbi:hypothetical protein M413DRAFT_415414 [Hebeloma cylindrosporum]|uniref:Uncharacterized protein n=1 Tax=Hebeloma cylindrosporum TaxID=76867 RepID=A0A0C2XPC2_HEBCY|nr:hypothetical protein M413DRAFT_415414 [Hebeloma cylindrosporum h7]
MEPQVTTEQQICNALALPDPVTAVSCLIHVVQQQPYAETVACIADTYESLASVNPSGADCLAQTLVLLNESPDVPNIAKHAPRRNPDQGTFSETLNLFLYEVISAAIAEPTSDPAAIAPTNPFFVGSVISASAVKYGLFASAAQIGAVALGIHFPGIEYQLYSGPEAYEELALGACLQLLIAGSVFSDIGQLGRNKGQLLPSLKSLLTNKTIKEPNGKKLLQVTIEHAEKGFPSDFSSGEAWNILFPVEAPTNSFPVGSATSTAAATRGYVAQIGSFVYRLFFGH